LAAFFALRWKRLFDFPAQAFGYEIAENCIFIASARQKLGEVKRNKIEYQVYW